MLDTPKVEISMSPRLVLAFNLASYHDREFLEYVANIGIQSKVEDYSFNSIGMHLSQIEVSEEDFNFIRLQNNKFHFYPSNRQNNTYFLG